MAAGVITVNRDTKPGLWPVMLGMGLVFSNMIKTMFGKELATIQFPEVKRPTSTRYRGIHVLTQREDGTGYRPSDHDIRRPVRIAALERLRREHGIVPGMPEPRSGGGRPAPR